MTDHTRPRASFRRWAYVGGAVAIVIGAVCLRLAMMPTLDMGAYPDPPGRGGTPIVENGGAAGAPEYLAASVGERLESHIWIIDVGTGEHVSPVDEPGVNYDDPAWSPDGGSLSFVRRGGKGLDPDTDIWEVRIDGSSLRRDASGVHVQVGPPCWSPHSEWLAFASPYPPGLYLVSREGYQPVKLTDQNDCFPDWSPDGLEIVFVRSAERTMAGSLCIYELESRECHELPVSTKVGPQLHPRWSPDGSHLAFAAESNGQLDVYTATPDGEEVVNVTRTPDLDEAWPDWSPEGDRLVFFRTGEAEHNGEAFGPGDLFVCDADGTAGRQVTHVNLPMSGLGWQPKRSDVVPRDAQPAGGGGRKPASVAAGLG